METAVRSERETAASISCSPNSLDSAYGSCGRLGSDSSIGARVQWNGRSANTAPVTLSLETLTSRSAPMRTHASVTLNVAIRLFENTMCGGLAPAEGTAAAWITTSWPRTTAYASPALLRSAWTYWAPEPP